MRDFFPHSPVLREGDALDRLLLLLAGGLSSRHSDRAARLGGRQLAPTWRGVVHAFGELRQEVQPQPSPLPPPLPPPRAEPPPAPLPAAAVPPRLPLSRRPVGGVAAHRRARLRGGAPPRLAAAAAALCRLLHPLARPLDPRLPHDDLLHACRRARRRLAHLRDRRAARVREARRGDPRRRPHPPSMPPSRRPPAAACDTCPDGAVLQAPSRRSCWCRSTPPPATLAPPSSSFA